MQSSDIYAQVLGLKEAWSVSSVDLDARQEEVRVSIEVRQGARLPCPECKTDCGVHDRRERKWRHLDTCEYRTVIIAQVPRVRCPEHGVRQAAVPWGDPGSRFTSGFEAYAIGWLLEAPVAAVSRRLRISWDQVDGIMQRAVQRGLARRDDLAPRRIAVDETSFKKRHEYVTVVTDVDTGAVRYVADNRRKESLGDFFDQFDPSELIEIVAVSIWAQRSRLPHMVRAARMVSDHLYGILNAVVLGVTNGVAESVNAKIQRVKRMACGFRNRERFRNAIYFHLGGLDLMPSSHTKP